MLETPRFGTSGLRGLASQLQGAETRRYVAAFIRYLASEGVSASRLLVGRDRRESSPAMTADVASATAAAGLTPVECGLLPTPALALHALAEGLPAVMVTGSHIPADRNGLKFFTPEGEITKQDEQGIVAALGADTGGTATTPEDGAPRAADRYRRRYQDFLGPQALHGRTIGVFEHSSIATDQIASLLHRAGATVVRLGRSAQFVPVDTEALSDPIYERRHGWITEHRLDAIVSTDGDGDRPLVIDEHGDFVRGDIVGLLSAIYLGAETVVTPVTTNSGIEDLGLFREIRRTQVGSPHVIAAMDSAARHGGRVVGFEANGGTLLGTDIEIEGRPLARLPTRDAILPLLCVLATAARAGQSLSSLVAGLPLRPAVSDRLTDVEADLSRQFTARLSADQAFAADFFSGVGDLRGIDSTDGPRITLSSGDVIHYRPSGNAPELRCYVESKSPDRVELLLRWGLDAARKAVRR